MVRTPIVKVGKNGIKWESIPCSLGGVSVFRGLTEIQLDDKGRFAMPVRYREALQKKAEGLCVITIDTEFRCLLIYPYSDWVKIEEKIEALPTFNRASRRLQRLILGHATETELDSSGRLLLTQPLREYAGLKKEIVLLGQGKKFELWDESEWQNQRQVWLEQGIDTGGAIPPDLEYLSL